MPARVTTVRSEENGHHLGTLDSAMTLFYTGFMACNRPEKLQHERKVVLGSSEEANNKLLCSKPTVRYQMADGQIGKLACKIKTVLFPQELLDTRSELKQKWMYNY